MKEEDIDIIMRTYVILHNMIVRDKRDNYKFTSDYDIVKVTTLQLGLFISLGPDRLRPKAD